MNQHEKEIVLRRIGNSPSNAKIIIGSVGELNKEEMINEIKNETRVGKLLVKIHMTGLRYHKKLINQA